MLPPNSFSRQPTLLAQTLFCCYGVGFAYAVFITPRRFRAVVFVARLRLAIRARENYRPPSRLSVGRWSVVGRFFCRFCFAELK